MICDDFRNIMKFCILKRSSDIIVNKHFNDSLDDKNFRPVQNGIICKSQIKFQIIVEIGR